MCDLALEEQLSGTIKLYDIDYPAACENRDVGNELSERTDAKVIPPSVLTFCVFSVPTINLFLNSILSIIDWIYPFFIIPRLFLPYFVSNFSLK